MCVRRDQNKKPVIVLGCFGSLDGGRDGGDVGTRVRWCRYPAVLAAKMISRSILHNL